MVRRSPLPKTHSLSSQSRRTNQNIPSSSTAAALKIKTYTTYWHLWPRTSLERHHQLAPTRIGYVQNPKARTRARPTWESRAARAGRASRAGAALTPCRLAQTAQSTQTTMLFGVQPHITETHRVGNIICLFRYPTEVTNHMRNQLLSYCFVGAHHARAQREKRNCVGDSSLDGGRGPAGTAQVLVQLCVVNRQTVNTWTRQRVR